MGAGERVDAGQRADAEAADLIREIDREAEEQKQRILAEARDRARDILAAADAEIAAETARAEALMEKHARIDAERLLGDVKLVEAAERQRMRRQVYDDAVAEARRRILELARGPAWKSALRALLAEALSGVGGDAEAKVSVSAGDRAAAAALLRELGRTCEIETVDADPGTVVVTKEGGRRRINNSIGVRLERAAESQEAVIAARLFGEG